MLSSHSTAKWGPVIYVCIAQRYISAGLLTMISDSSNKKPTGMYRLLYTSHYYCWLHAEPDNTGFNVLSVWQILIVTSFGLDGPLAPFRPHGFN